MRKSISEIQTQINERVLILDGATGTYLQQHGSSGCNDALCLTNPQLVRQMHSDYIAAGADIIETNSFNCNRFSLTEYGLEDKVYDISKRAAEIAREAAGDTVLVAGSIGPTSKTLSMSTDVNTPESREVSFQEMHDTYCDQIRGLIDGGADLLLVETVFDTLNCKCAMKAIDDVCKEKGIVMPVMVSVTLSDNSGRTLSGQTLEAFVASIGGTALPSRPETQSSILFSVGLNCGFGAKQLLPYIKRLNEIVPYNISVHPNAGLPNVMGEYDETPETFAENARQALEDGLRINIFGGCCGTTPDHIRALKEIVRQYTPTSHLSTVTCQLSTINCQLSTVNCPKRPGAPATQRYLHQCWREDKCCRFCEIQEADSSEGLRGSTLYCPPAGGEWSTGNRHLYGRRHDRRRRSNDYIPTPHCRRTRDSQSADND